MKGREGLSDMFSLEHRVVLITGSAAGLGWAMAQCAAQAGAHVLINDINEKAIAARLDELSGAGLIGSAAPFDVRDEGAVEEGIAAAIKLHGQIDVLVNNAGHQIRRPLIKFSTEDWKSIFDLHVHGTFFVTRAVARHMVSRRSGSIIMVGSVAVQSNQGGITPYAAAKGAVNSMGRSLAVELGQYGITCNVIWPGFMQTEHTRKLQSDPTFQAFVERRVPLKRWGQPAELGPVVVYLASKAGSYVSGSVITIDGGMLAATGGPISDDTVVTNSAH